ncbi:hypothetical protein Q1695_000898 [Nippostrongylus brasiliensis]|nr:hypothetical protein Q1695_000898 [Nippostrongylus brasiliensis]
MACHGRPVVPPSLRNTKSIESITKGLDEEIRPEQRWATWCPSDVPCNPVSNGSRPTVFTKSHYVSAPPDLRQLGSCDCISDLRLLARSSVCHPSSG